jgi:SAM-dependent methyltransferase
MNADDWENRYRAKDMPWEKGSGAPGLTDFLEAHRDLPRGRVVVPGCGTGHDVCAWASHGFEAIALDLAPSAVEWTRERLRAAGLEAVVQQGDFLRDEPIAQVDWVFEHTLYCAIDPADRDRYKAAVLKWLKPKGQFLAIHYMIDEREGPPYGCTQADLINRFSTALELRQGWVPRSYPNRTGLELMLWWQRKVT